MTRTHAVLIGGGFNGVLSALPIIGTANCLCCLWVVGGGVITAWLLQQAQSDALELGEGAIGGLLAGVVGAVVYTLVWVPLQLMLGSLTGSPGGAFEMGDVDVPPEMLQMLEATEQIMSNPPLMALLAFFMMLVAGLVFSTVGGLLGAFFFRKAAPPDAPGGAGVSPAGGTDIVPPPPPV